MARSREWCRKGAGAFARAVLAFAVSSLVLSGVAHADPDTTQILPHPANAPVARPVLLADVTPAPAPYTDVDAPPPAKPPAPPPPAQLPPAPNAAPPGIAAPTPPEVTAQDNDPRALTDFRPALDPYGSWVEDEKYGTVWVPSRAIVGESFAPYVSSGHWAMDTGNNWVWVSDFSFGDVVFHYGRWVWTAYGWSWVPGYQYAPAWVTWRTPTSSYEYVGWAPSPPAYVWFGGAPVAWGFGVYSPYYWVFCPSAFVFAPYPYAYIVTHPLYVRSIARYTRVYHPATPHVAASPTLAAARVPRQAWPTDRIAAAPRLASAATLNGAHSGIATARVNGAGRIVSGDRAVPLGDRAFRDGAPRYGMPSRPVIPPGRLDTAQRAALPPGRLVPPSRFDAPSRTIAPGSAFRDTYSFPRERSFDTARPLTPTRFDAPARTTFPGHVYTPSPASRPSFSPERFNAPSHSPSFSPTRSPSFAPSHSFSPPRSYSPPPMQAAPRSYSPPPMRSPHHR